MYCVCILHTLSRVKQKGGFLAVFVRALIRAGVAAVGARLMFRQDVLLPAF